MPTILWAVWGLLGAFAYAALRLPAVLSEGARKDRGRRLAEFAIALTLGPIYAAALGPSVISWVTVPKGTELEAVAFVVGLVANPTSPLLIKLATGDILRRFGRQNGDDHEP